MCLGVFLLGFILLETKSVCWVWNGEITDDLARSPQNRWCQQKLESESDSRSVVSNSLQTHMSVEFSRQEHWSGLPFSSPGHLPDPGICPALPGDSLPSELPERNKLKVRHCNYRQIWGNSKPATSLCCILIYTSFLLSWFFPCLTYTVTPSSLPIESLAFFFFLRSNTNLSWAALHSWQLGQIAQYLLHKSLLN